MVPTEISPSSSRSVARTGERNAFMKQGQITDLDIRVIRSITELEKENPTLQEVTFHKAVEAGDIMALMVDRRGMDTFLASGAKLAKNLGDRVGRRVKVLSQGGDDRDFLEGLFIPFSILTINTKIGRAHV